MTHATILQLVYGIGRAYSPEGRELDRSRHSEARLGATRLRRAEWAYARPGTCGHFTITDEQLDERENLIARTWGGWDSLVCPDCHESLSVYAEVVYAGEPHGAGDDPAGRPSARTNPEYWTE